MIFHDMKSSEKGTATTRCGKKVTTTSEVVTAWPSDVTCPPCKATWHGASS